MPRPVGARGRLSESVLVKLSAQQAEEVEAAAVVEGVSSPELIRQALDEFLNRNRPNLTRVLKSIRLARRSLGAPSKELRG